MSVQSRCQWIPGDHFTCFSVEKQGPVRQKGSREILVNQTLKFQIYKNRSTVGKCLLKDLSKVSRDSKPYF